MYYKPAPQASEPKVYYKPAPKTNVKPQVYYRDASGRRI